jgi:hypothetical protein
MCVCGCVLHINQRVAYLVLLNHKDLSVDYISFHYTSFHLLSIQDLVLVITPFCLERPLLFLSMSPRYLLILFLTSCFSLGISLPCFHLYISLLSVIILTLPVMLYYERNEDISFVFLLIPKFHFHIIVLQ